MKNKFLVFIFAIIFLVGTMGVVSAETKLQVWKNMTSGTNVSWVDNDGNWYALGNLNITGGIYFNNSKCSSGQVLTTDSITGLVSCTPVTGLPGIVNGSGTLGYIPMWNSSGSLNNSVIYQNGGMIGIGIVNPIQKLTVVGNQANEPSLGTNPATAFSLLSSNALYGMYVGVNPTTGNSWIQAMRNDAATAYNLNLQPNGGNVGIGTTAPTRLLQLESGTNTVMKFRETSGTATNWTLGVLTNGNFVINDESNDTQRLVIDGSGNVGIGTTVPNATLHLNITTENNLTGLLINKVSDLGETALIVNHASSSSLRGIADFQNSLGSVMKILADGNVGINTTTPQQTLNVKGQANVTGAITTDTRFSWNGESTGMYKNTNNQIDFYTNGAARMILDSNGKIGINTSTPQTMFEVVNTTTSGTFGGYPAIVVNNPSNNGYAMFGLMNGSGVGGLIGSMYMDTTERMAVGTYANVDLILETARTERMRITNTGFVGIGTASPRSKQEINYVTGSTLTGVDWIGLTINRSDSSSPAYGSGIALLAYQNKGTLLSSRSDSFSMFSYDNSTYAPIDLFKINITTRNTGINTSTPTNALTVVGEGNFTGNLYSNGALITSGNASWNESWANTKYVDVTGDTMTGGLALTNANITFNSDSTGIDFYGNNMLWKKNGQGMVLTVDSTRSIEDYLKFENGTGGTQYKVWHEANLHLSDLGGISGSGTSGYISSWNGTNSINNSVIYQNGTNIGIGTTSPKNTLNVVGDSNITSTANFGGNIYLGSSTDRHIRYYTSTNWYYYLNASGNNFFIDDAENAKFFGAYYGSGGATKYANIMNGTIYVYNDGKVGIGRSSPGYSLDVRGPVNASAYFVNGTQIGTGTITGGGTSGYLSSWNGTTSLNNSLMYQKGISVGIGTQNISVTNGIVTSGASVLGVVAPPGKDAFLRIIGGQGSTVGGLIIGNDDYGDLNVNNASVRGTIDYGAFIFNNSANTFSVFQNYASGYLGLGAGSRKSDLIIQATNGYVGINSTTPQNTLDVKGIINATGKVRAGTSYLTTLTGTGSGAYLRFGNETTDNALGTIGTYASAFNIDSYNGQMIFSFSGVSKTNISTVGNVTTATDVCIVGGNCLSNRGTGTITGSGTINNISKFTASGAIGDSLIYDTGSAIGIKTSSPQYTLDVKGTARIATWLAIDASDSQKTFSMHYNAASWPNYSAYFYQTGAADVYGTRGLIINEMNGQEVSNYGISLATNGTSRIFISNGGNVGINQVNPSHKLTVAGGNLAVESGNMYLASGYPLHFDYGISNSYYVQKSGTNLYFYTGGGYAFMNGSMGIGTTAPGYKLDVMGVVNASAYLVNGTAIGTGSITGGGTSGYIARWNGTGSINNSIIYQSSSNNVGIGTTNPGAKLEVNGSTRLWHGGTSYYTEFANTNEINTFNSTGGATTMYLQYRSGETNIGAANLRIQKLTSGIGTYLDASGRVGIGTSSPTVKLDVTGTIENGLVLWFPMDGGSGTTILDKSRNHYDGNVSAANWGLGKFGNAFAFDGSDDWIQLDTPFTTTTDMTVSVWVKTASTDADNGIFSHCSGGPVGIAYYLNNGALEYQYYSGTWYQETSTGTVKDGNWHFVTFIKNSTHMTFYIDGEFDSTHALVASITSTMNAVGSKWGPCDGSYGSVFTGFMDDFKVYNRELSKREVAELYRQGSSSFALGGSMNGSLNVTGNIYVNGTAITTGNASWNETYANTKYKAIGIETWNSTYSGFNKTYADTLYGAGNINGGGTSGYIARFNNTGSINNSVIYQSGTNIGINTTSPGGILDIQSATPTVLIGPPTGAVSQESSLEIYRTTGGGARVVAGDIYTTPGNVGTIGLNIDASNQSSYSLILKSHSSGYVLLNPTAGNVGVGTNTPQNTFNVVGDINATGYVLSSGVNLSALNATGLIKDWNATGYIKDWNATGFIRNWSLVAGNISGFGTANNLSKFSAAGTITNSLIYDNGTNVGIGIATPQYGKLEIASTASNTGGLALYRGTGSTARHWINSNDIYLIQRAATDTYGLAINPTGSVGIGTVSPNTTLHVVGTTNFTGASYLLNSKCAVGQALTTDATTGLVSCTTVTSISGVVNGSGTSGYIARFNGTGSINNSVIYQGASNNIGINTTSPNNNLEIRGASGLRISDPANIYRGNLVFGNLSNGWNSGIRTYDSGDAEMRIWHANAAGQIVLATGYNGETNTTMPTDGLFIDQNKVGIGYPSPAASTGKLTVNGNVGIGTVSPNTTLHVVGTTNFTGASYLLNSKCATGQVLTTDATTGLISCTTPAGGISGAGTALYIPMWNGTGSINNSVIYQNGGNISIGHSTPRQKLHVYAASGNAYGRFGYDTTYYMDLGYSVTSEYGYLQAMANGVVDDILINPSGGNVGINTTTPGTTFDVHGTANVTGATYLYNSKCAAGQVLTTDATTGLISCATASGLSNVVNGTGTLLSIPMWNGTGSINNSIMTQSGTKINVNGNLNTSSAITIKASTTGIDSDGSSLYLTAGGNTYLNSANNAYVTSAGAMRVNTCITFPSGGQICGS